MFYLIGYFRFRSYLVSRRHVVCLWSALTNVVHNPVRRLIDQDLLMLTAQNRKKGNDSTIV